MWRGQCDTYARASSVEQFFRVDHSRRRVFLGREVLRARWYPGLGAAAHLLIVLKVAHHQSQGFWRGLLEVVEVGALRLLRILRSVGALATRAHKVEDGTPWWDNSSLADLWKKTAMAMGVRCIRSDGMRWLQKRVVIERRELERGHCRPARSLLGGGCLRYWY